MGGGSAIWMQEGACGRRRRTVAPVKIDPPHSFPTFSPRERFATTRERGWYEKEEKEVEEVEEVEEVCRRWRRGRLGASGREEISWGLSTTADSVYPHLRIFTNILRAYVRVCASTCARARSRRMGGAAGGGAGAHVGTHTERYGDMTV